MLQVTASGNIGKNAEINTVNGKSVINFSIAHNENFVDKNGVKQSRTEWIDCNYWPKSTKVAPYLTAGTQVIITGTPSSKAYSRNNGEIASTLVVRVDRLELVSGQKTNESVRAQAPAKSNNAPEGESQHNIGQNREKREAAFEAEAEEQEENHGLPHPY